MTDDTLALEARMPPPGPQPGDGLDEYWKAAYEAGREYGDGRAATLRRERDAERKRADDGELLRLEERRLRQAAEAEAVTLRQQLEQMETDHAACRENFHTMQAAANKLRIRAERSEAILAEAGKVLERLVATWDSHSEGLLVTHMAPIIRELNTVRAKIKEATDAR